MRPSKVLAVYLADETGRGDQERKAFLEELKRMSPMLCQLTEAALWQLENPDFFKDDVDWADLVERHYPLGDNS